MDTSRKVTHTVLDELWQEQPLGDKDMERYWGMDMSRKVTHTVINELGEEQPLRDKDVLQGAWKGSRYPVPKYPEEGTVFKHRCKLSGQSERNATPMVHFSVLESLFVGDTEEGAESVGILDTGTSTSIIGLSKL